MSTDVPGWVHDFNQHLFELDTNVTALKTSDVTLHDAARIYAALQDFKLGLRLISDGMEHMLIELFADSDEVVINEGGTVQKVIDTPRKAWKNQEVATEVAQRIQRMAVDMDTGEVKMTTEEMITKLLDFVYPSYWRLKPLRDIGINPDDYCEVGEPKPTIKYQKAK
jgi:hypothetical protein